ncbi:protein SMALL AUXIN UP-REGULATED RNA 12-like [Cryptomeria japonica]|uniref:protein SMALL AUXIN UP-REGULATED RNA 12-like n=1 Tax=Cryptomeria japonica TaxID=3369 RepID=UPI0025ABD15F|nr:protein SMALL AUXIN UP-REGULATED RNA 12-like [Cryptomeria japonica]
MARSKGNPQVLIVKHIVRTLCRLASSIMVDGYSLSSKSRRHFSSRDEFLNRSCGGLPADVPKGHCAVYVGSEQSRYIIPTKYLNHSLFRELLDKAEEEYGFDHQMGLTIPCEEVAFQYLTSILEKRVYH